MPIFILSVVVIALGGVVFFLWQALRKSRRDWLALERSVSPAAFVDGILKEIGTPLGFLSREITTIRDYVSYLQEMTLRLKTKTTLSSEELKQLEQFKGKDRLESVLADIDPLLDKMERGIRDGQRGLTEIRLLSSTKAEAGAPVSLRDLLERVLALLSPQMEGKILIHRDYETLPPYPIAPGPLAQALRNLLTSSIESMPEGGHLYLWLKKGDRFLEIGVKNSGEKAGRSSVIDRTGEIVREIGGSFTHKKQGKESLSQIRLPFPL